MPCPQPLDPVCVAILLRVTEQPLTCEQLAEELELRKEAVDDRIQRLRAIGAIENRPDRPMLRARPDAYRIILDIASRTRSITPSGKEISRRPDTISNRVQRLKQVPMFAALPFEEMESLACVSRTQDLAAGEVLLLEGDDCQGLYVVENGVIRLSKGSTSCASGFGREQTIRLMVAGDSFNEVPVFDDGPNPVTAEAIEDSRVILVPRQEVLNLVDRSPEFARLIIAIMAQRLRHMLAMIEDVSMRDVTGRVAKILLQVTHPSEGVGAGLTVGRRVTQREIAEMAGTAREVVARVLKKMERSGAISVRRGDVRILDDELMRSFI